MQTGAFISETGAEKNRAQFFFFSGCCDKLLYIVTRLLPLATIVATHFNFNFLMFRVRQQQKLNKQETLMKCGRTQYAIPD